MVDYVDVYETGGTTVQVEVNGETTLQTTQGQTVQVETIAGIKGETGQSGFVVEANGTYPARPPGALAVTFVGADNPDTLGLMHVGDTWINTVGTNNTGPGYVKGNTKSPVLNTNYVTNPSFENTSLPGLATNNGATYTSSSTQAYSGMYSLRVACPTTGADSFVTFTVTGLAASTAYVASAWVFVESIAGSALGGRSLMVVNGAGNTGYGQDSSLTTSHVTGVWVRKFVRFSTASSETSVKIRLYAPNGVVYWDAVQIEPALVPQAYSFPRNYFDGSLDGCSWTGTANASTSQKLLLSQNDEFNNRIGQRLDGQLLVPDSTQTSGWRFTTSLYLEGTGFPTMDAPVGTMYIDTSATNGAIRWIKTKTGSGNGNWQVEYGDTGWREIKSLMVDSSIDKSYTPYGRIRRVGATVTCDFEFKTTNPAINPTVPMKGAMPSGFRSPVYGVYANRSYDGLSVFWDTNDGPRVYGSSAGAIERVNNTYLTPDSWPLTLPGVAY